MSTCVIFGNVGERYMYAIEETSCELRLKIYGSIQKNELLELFEELKNRIVSRKGNFRIFVDQRELSITTDTLEQITQIQRILKPADSLGHTVVFMDVIDS